MAINIKFTHNLIGTRGNLLLQYFGILVLTTFFSVLVHDIWVAYLSIYHTVLELACVFIALSIFSSIWFAYGSISREGNILGFGYFAVAIFDVLHIIYFLKLNLSEPLYFDLSTQFWIFGRISEAIVLLLSIEHYNRKSNKFVSLSITLFVALGASYIITNNHEYLPVLLTEKGVTPIKVALEFVVISIYMYSLFKLKNKFNDNSVITHRYIFFALLLAVPSEICFTVYTSVSSFVWTLGHILKILSYFFLFRGIFISTVTYPYKKLEDEHKKLDEAHKEAKNISETLKEILDALPVAVLKFGINGRLKHISKEFEDMLGYDRNDLYGLSLPDVLSMFSNTDDHEQTLSDLALQSDYQVNNVLRTCKTKKGDYVKLSISFQKIRSGVLVRLRDAKKEQELENIHLQTQTILNAVSNCILMVGKNRKILLCNKELEAVFEMDRKDILGMNIDEINEKMGFAASEIFDLALNNTAEKQCHEVSLTLAKGNVKEILLHLTPIGNIYGEIIGAIGVGSDITELKKKQQKMLQQEKLALLGQMGAAIVHETRNFLSTIKGRCQLIDTLSCDDTLKKHTKQIDNNVNEINRIISEFLFLSKPREAELLEVSIHDILCSIKDMVEASSLMKGVDVDFHLCREERYLLCDESQIKQVILNITKNAIDAMADIEDSRLSITTGYNERSNEMYIKISDNGVGIAKESLDKLGTKFFTTKKSGTGLGLSVCYQIIKGHNGRIEVDSKLGVGTTFTILLPCINDEELDEAI